MPRSLGEVVPRSFLQVAMPADRPPARISEGSGRLELANWIVSTENPLTARVLANRIWLHLLGDGIVHTPDNFGLTGDHPSHPELLDHLAQELVNDNWSTKRLIRQIVLSHSYQLSSLPSAAAQQGDPENKLLSHANRRALDVEALRDTILLLSGKLDRSSGGPSLPPGFKSEFEFKFTTLRRSIYVPVFRNSLYEFFATFDFANPNFTVGARNESTIPTQFLFLRNSPFVHEQAKGAATLLLANHELTENQRLELLFLQSTGRRPTEKERAACSEFLGQNNANQDETMAWAALQRALFSSLDFRYLP